MARPNPTVIYHNENSAGRVLEVCAGDCVYAVLYQGQPIQVRQRQHMDIAYPSWKYSKSLYVNSAHAFRLADRLNSLFNTLDFSVVKYPGGRSITRNK
ncbi:hypothetical protein UFOVP700_11 [uncultured Caudovirales phage]|uniref:Uncharacterized protein n=1 Tax=uncultured Caudovirales phage TaxID=2100421 RepID=A0A6J5NFD3_9CAUD|nr:hypothetical protein UFOVP700_11 [uncultured Caudovirales phage]